MLEKLKAKVRTLDRKTIILLSSFFITLTVSSVLGFLYFKLSASSKERSIEKTIEIPSALIADSPDIVNVLLLGYGGAGHDGGGLSDSIILVSANTKKKEVVLVSIPRDLWVALPVDYDNTQNFKINAAYAIGSNEVSYPNKKPIYRGEMGGGELAKYAASVVTGLEVDYFVSIDFGGLIDVVDLLGGVEVNVTKPFDDHFYPVKGLENEICGKSPEEIADAHAKYSGFQLEKQFECRYEHLHFEKGLQKMDGETVLKFVRSRHSDQYGGDFARSERQHLVLTAIKEKLISLDAISESSSLFEKLVNSVKTDIDSKTIKGFLSSIGSPSDYKIGHIHLTEDNVLSSSTGPGGQFILIPREGIDKWISIHKFISGE